MAPVTKADEADYFAIMGLTPTATDAEIRKAHKKLSLALHPDKNRDVDPLEAAARFSTMQLAYEVLMDPSARLAAAERTKAEAARRERRGAYEGKRKAMAEELEKREGEEREKRFKGVQDERRRAETLRRLREEGRRLREERERRVNVSNTNDALQQTKEERDVNDTRSISEADVLERLHAKAYRDETKAATPKSTPFPSFSFSKTDAKAGRDGGSKGTSAEELATNESDILRRMRQAARKREEDVVKADES